MTEDREDPDVEAHALARCADCGRVWLDLREEGWLTHLPDADGTPVFYCPTCAARPFG